MCFSEVLYSLAANGVVVTPTQVRWAMVSGKVTRPPLDASLRFNFGPDHLQELVEHFNRKKTQAGRRPN